MGHLLTDSNKLNLEGHKAFTKPPSVSRGTESARRTYPVPNVTSPGRHGGVAVAVPPPVVPTVGSAPGSPVRAGARAGARVVSAGAPPRPRPEGATQSFRAGLPCMFNVSKLKSSFPKILHYHIPQL